MSEPVHILHAAPLYHRPPRSRQARVSYAPCVTTVRIPELSRRDTQRGPDVPVNGGHVLRTVLVDGAIFRPIGCHDAFEGRKPGPTAAEFARWLEGHADMRALDDSDVARCLEGTPVLARSPGQRTPVRPYEAWNALRVGQIVHETRDIAEAAVGRYVADALALVDGKPFMRMPGPLAYHDDAMDHTRIMRHPGSWTSNGPANRGIAFRVDRLADLAAFEGRSRVEKLSPDWDAALFAGIHLTRDDDLDLNLRTAFRVYHGHHDRLQGAGPFHPSRVDALARLSVLGSVGMIDPGERGPAVELLAELSRDALADRDRGWLPDMAKRFLRYAEGYGRPLAAEASVDLGDDLDSLGALAH